MWALEGDNARPFQSPLNQGMCVVEQRKDCYRKHGLFWGRNAGVCIVEQLLLAVWVPIPLVGGSPLWTAVSMFLKPRMQNAAYDALRDWDSVVLLLLKSGRIQLSIFKFCVTSVL